MKKIIFYFALIFFFNGVSFAGTGYALLEACSIDYRKAETKIEFGKIMYCAGFIKGVTQDQHLLSFLKDVPQVYCLPFDKGLSTNDFIPIVVKYLKENSDKLNNIDVSLVLGALKEAFPCKENQ